MATSKSTARVKAWRESHPDQVKAYMAAYYAANKARMNAQGAALYRANADAYKARARKWEQENIERKRELRAIYRAKYREKIKEFSRTDWLKHGEKRRARKAEYRTAHPEAGAHSVRLRQTRKMRATPLWADLAAVKAFYREAARLRKQTGEAHHVDHIIPLRHPLVCGLHNEFNLRVVPATVNMAKANRFEV